MFEMSALCSNTGTKTLSPFVDSSVKVWGSSSSESTGHSLWMMVNSRSDWLKSGLVWSRTLSTLEYVPENTVLKGGSNGRLNTPWQLV